MRAIDNKTSIRLSAMFMSLFSFSNQTSSVWIVSRSFLSQSKTPPSVADDRARYDFIASQVDGVLWNDTLKTRIQLKFGLHTPALHPSELKSGFDLGKHMLRLSLLITLSSNLGIKLSPAALLRFQQGGDAAFLSKIEPFALEDLESIDVDVNGNAAEEEATRSQLLKDVKTTVVHEEAAIHSASVVSPLEQSQPASFHSLVCAILGWFDMSGLRTSGDSRPAHALVAQDRAIILHERIRVEARLLDYLVYLFDIPTLSSPPPPSSDVSIGPHRPSPINFEFRSTLIELARLLLQLTSDEGRKLEGIRVKNGLKEQDGKCIHPQTNEWELSNPFLTRFPFFFFSSFFSLLSSRLVPFDLRHSPLSFARS